MKHYKAPSILSVAALTFFGTASADQTSWGLSHLATNVCVQHDLAVPVIHDDGTKTGTKMVPVLDDRSMVITFLSPEEARSEDIKACAAGVAPEPVAQPLATQTAYNTQPAMLSEASFR